MTFQSGPKSHGDVPILMRQAKSENYVLGKSSKIQFRAGLPAQRLVPDVHCLYLNRVCVLGVEW